MVKEVEPRVVYAVWTNSDLCEGRGSEYVMCYCELETTALRLAKRSYVQGSDARVTEVQLFYIDGKWYAPGPNVDPGTREDIEEDRRIKVRKERALARTALVERLRSMDISEDGTFEEVASQLERGSDGDVVVLGPPFVVDRSDIEQIAVGVAAAIRAVRETTSARN